MLARIFLLSAALLMLCALPVSRQHGPFTRDTAEANYALEIPGTIRGLMADNRGSCLYAVVVEFDEVAGALGYWVDVRGNGMTPDHISTYPDFRDDHIYPTTRTIPYTEWVFNAPAGKHWIRLWLAGNAKTSPTMVCADVQPLVDRFTLNATYATMPGDRPPPPPPVADFSWTVDEVDGLEVHFDAAPSTGTDLRYEWQIDSGVFQLDYVWRTVDYTFDEPGTYQVTLRVQDTNFSEDTETKMVTVEDGGLLKGNVTVPAGTEAGGIRISYSGTRTGSVETASNGRYEKFLVIGSYTVTAPTGLCYVPNTESCQSSVPLTISRVNGELQVEPQEIDFRFVFGDPNALINVTKDPNDPYTFAFDGSASTDPDDDIATYDWSFGDGEVANGAQPPPHTFADREERTVTLVVTDETGLQDTAQVTLRPGTFTVTGQFFEQVCGRPSTRAPFQSPAHVRVQARDSDGFESQKAPGSDGFRFDSPPGDFSVFPDPMQSPFENTPDFPAWAPAIRFFDLQADTPGQDFELCYDPGSPTLFEIASRNGRFSSDNFAMRNGGLIRICDEDGVSREVAGFGTAGGDLVYDYGLGSRQVIPASGCHSLRPLNPAPSPMHLSLLSSGLFGPMELIVVVLPGVPVPALTALTSDAEANSTRLEVAANDGFAVGDRLLIDPDGEGEAVYTMEAEGSIIVSEPLRRAYPAGTLILNISNPPAGIDVWNTPAPTATPTTTPTATETPSPTSTWTPLPTNTASPTATSTSTATATHSPTNTATTIPTATATDVATRTPTRSATATSAATRTVTPTPTRTPVRFKCADVSDDGRVTLKDLLQIAERFGTKLGDARYRSKYDLNYDRRVSAIDIAIAMSQLGRRCRR